MGFGRMLENDQADGCKEFKLERHRPLPFMTGWRRSSERRNATPAILLPSKALVAESAAVIFDNWPFWNAAPSNGRLRVRGGDWRNERDVRLTLVS